MPMNWLPPTLPYFCKPVQLPASLPTEKEFVQATDSPSDDLRRVITIEPHYIVKYGRRVNENEGHALLFLEGLDSSVKTPKLYAMYRMANNQFCLIMERLPGEPLHLLWGALRDGDKSTICANLCNFLTNLRDVSSPGIYGSVSGGPLPHHLFWVPEMDPTICGPFLSETALNTALVKKNEYIAALNNTHSYKADFYSRNLDKALHGHKPVFTHSDLQRKNIVISKSDDGTNHFEVGLVDWELAGWYPDYWEYFTTNQAYFWDDDWLHYVERVTGAWPCELAMMKMLYQDLVF